MTLPEVGVPNFESLKDNYLLCFTLDTTLPGKSTKHVAWTTGSE